MECNDNLILPILNKYMKWVLEHDTAYIYFVGKAKVANANGSILNYAIWEDNRITIYFHNGYKCGINDLSTELKKVVVVWLIECLNKDMEYQITNNF